MPKSNIVTRPLTAASGVAARVSVASAAAFLALLVALHVLEPEFDPAWRFISEYELGRYGALMALAFLALAGSAVSLLVAIRWQIRTVGGYVGLAALALGAVGSLLAAVFTTDPITATRPTSHGLVHSAGAALGGSTGPAALLIGWSLARNRGWSSVRRSLLWTTGIACIGLAATLAMQVLIAQSHARFGPHVLVGWPNRMLIAAYAGWILALAIHTSRLANKSVGATETPGPTNKGPQEDRSPIPTAEV
jgi:Protein of unknown function (DUF998)